MTLQVRAATPDDTGALAALAALTFPLACPPGTDPEDVAAFVAGNLTAEHLGAHVVDGTRDLLLVADSTQPGRPLAYALVLDGPPPAGVEVAVPTRMLSKFYAHPDAHGTPVAALLMGRVLDACRARGASSLWLGVNQRNERAQRFYVKYGFEVVGTKHMRVGDEVHDDFVLTRAV